MANQISGGADATLVAAAGKAATANVPKDLSGTHERIAKSYAKEAEARGKLWGKATEVIGAVTSKLIERAKKPSGEIDWNTDGIESIYSVGGDSEDKVDDKFTSPAEGYSKTSYDGVTKNVPYEYRFNPEDYNHKDYDGNTKSITPQTTEQKLDELRDQKNNVSKDDFGTRKERKAEKRRIRKVMDNVRQSNVDFAAFDEMMTKQLAEGGVNEKASGMYNMQGMMFARAMQSRGKAVSESDPKLAMYDGARAIKGYNDEGHMVFTYTDKYGKPFKNKDGSNVTIDKDGLSELFVPVSPKRAVMDVLVDPAPIKKNYKYGFDSFENEIKRSVDSQITDKNTFLDIAFYHGPGGGSLADSLNAIEYDGDKVPVATETPLFGQFMGALEGLSADSKNDLDVTGDGEFTKADYANQESFDLLVNKALSGENLELGKSLLKMHYNTQARKIFDNVVKVNTKVENQAIVNKAPGSGEVVEQPPQANYKIGGAEQTVRNPMTGNLENTGYKYDKNSNLLFDDSGFLKDIQTGVQTKDYFGNKYEPVLDRKTGKLKGFSIYDRVEENKRGKYYTVEKILGFGYQAGLKVEFDPNSYKK